jgi:hypothetical protein
MSPENDSLSQAPQWGRVPNEREKIFTIGSDATETCCFNGARLTTNIKNLCLIKLTISPRIWET